MLLCCRASELAKLVKHTRWMMRQNSRSRSACAAPAAVWQVQVYVCYLLGATEDLKAGCLLRSPGSWRSTLGNSSAARTNNCQHNQLSDVTTAAAAARAPAGHTSKQHAAPARTHTHTEKPRAQVNAKDTHAFSSAACLPDCHSTPLLCMCLSAL